MSSLGISGGLYYDERYLDCAGTHFRVREVGMSGSGVRNPVRWLSASDTTGIERPNEPQPGRVASLGFAQAALFSMLLNALDSLELENRGGSL